MNTVSGNTFCKRKFMQTCTCLKCNVNYYKFNTKGVVSSYTETQRTSIPQSVGVVACISQPCNKGCNLIRQVETRIDSQQYTSFLMEIVSWYPTVRLISIVHDNYVCLNFLFINVIIIFYLLLYRYPVHNSTKEIFMARWSTKNVCFFPTGHRQVAI
jgi:hypothetical protein